MNSCGGVLGFCNPLGQLLDQNTKELLDLSSIGDILTHRIVWSFRLSGLVGLFGLFGRGQSEMYYLALYDWFVSTTFCGCMWEGCQKISFYFWSYQDNF